MAKRRQPARNGSTRPASASRAQFNQLLRMLLDQAAALDKLREEQHIQFRRMAQLQAELDALKQSLDKTRNPA